MNWLTNFVRPKIQKLVHPKEVPDDLWHRCPKCSEMIFHRELEKNLRALRPSHAHAGARSTAYAV